MKGPGKLKKIFYSSWFMAFMPALLLMLFLPKLGMKYEINVKNTGPVYKNYTYVDLDSNGITEVVSSGKGIPYYNILISDNGLKVYDQWNLKDFINSSLSGYFFGNYDKDSFKEIYIFTHRGDSLFLNVNEFFDKDGLRISRLFISRIGFIDNEVTSNVYPAGFFDLDNDGIDEFYFSIQTGFGLLPRRLYCYNFVSGDLFSSGLAGEVCLYPEFIDSDDDKKPEIFGYMSASGNFNEFVPYSDHSSWLMIYNEKLEFEFQPVEFRGFPNTLNIKAFHNNKFRGYILSHLTNSADSTVLKSRVMFFSLNGELLKERLYSEMGFNHDEVKIIILNKDRIFLTGNKIVEINTDLETVNELDPPFNSRFSVNLYDLNHDGREEFILYFENEEKMIVYDSFFEKIAEADLHLSIYYTNYSDLITKDGSHSTFVTTMDSSYFIELKKNNSYLLGYLAYPGIYFAFLLFIFFIRRITLIQISQKQDMKQRLVTLQLQGIKAQLDPHFTFNTLNSIASLIYLKEREAAYDYLNKFTRILRSMLNDSDKIYRKLDEEIKFVTTYLELEKLRFGDKFDYKVEVGNSVTLKESVPKLVLQTFAENAVKHGLSPLPDGGLLIISICRESNYLRMKIKDNGIGRSASSGKSTSTGKGLKLTEEFYDILNQINRHPIKNSITDLFNENGEPAGTLAEVWVPIDIEN
jgi:two-component sensor histidine kinase